MDSGHGFLLYMPGSLPEAVGRKFLYGQVLNGKPDIKRASAANFRGSFYGNAKRDGLPVKEQLSRKAIAGLCCCGKGRNRESNYLVAIIGKRIDNAYGQSLVMVIIMKHGLS